MCNITCERHKSTLHAKLAKLVGIAASHICRGHMLHGFARRASAAGVTQSSCTVVEMLQYLLDPTSKMEAFALPPISALRLGFKNIKANKASITR